MEEFKKLLEKKAREQHGKPVDEKKLEAKASMAKELSDMLGAGITDDIKGGLAKVTVASDSPEGLKEGLEKAEDIVSPEEDEEKEDSEDESEDDKDIETKIQELRDQLKTLEFKRK